MTAALPVELDSRHAPASARLAQAELAASYLVEHAARGAGPRALQGDRRGAIRAEAERALEAASPAEFPALFLVARKRVLRVPERAARGLFLWAGGVSIDLYEHVPPPERVLRLQATGRRCASLLPDSVSPAPHASGLEFLVHDLCHLEKFAGSEHYLEQVGFFSTLAQLGDTADFRALERELGPEFIEDRQRLGSDVNGSSVYLFALLNMKLKMAARRCSARNRGVVAPQTGPLDAAELAVFSELAERLYDVFALTGALREAARVTSARRDDTRAALLVTEFRARGEAALRAAPPLNAGLGASRPAPASSREAP